MHETRSGFCRMISTKHAKLTARRFEISPDWQSARLGRGRRLPQFLIGDQQMWGDRTGMLVPRVPMQLPHKALIGRFCVKAPPPSRLFSHSPLVISVISIQSCSTWSNASQARFQYCLVCRIGRGPIWHGCCCCLALGTTRRSHSQNSSNWNRRKCCLDYPRCKRMLWICSVF